MGSDAHGRIRVEPEGRDGVWLPDRDDVVAYLETLPGPIHCFMGTAILIGADWPVDKVVEDVRDAKRVALLTGDAALGNLGHALSVVVETDGDGVLRNPGEALHMFDVGDVSAVIVPPTATAELSRRDG